MAAGTLNKREDRDFLDCAFSASRFHGLAAAEAHPRKRQTNTPRSQAWSMHHPAWFDFHSWAGREYLTLFNKGVTINTSLFATTFFTLTGFHGLHVCVGLIALLVVLGLAYAGDFQPGRTEAVRTIGLYWHFVDIVWVFVFATVYLAGPAL